MKRAYNQKVLLCFQTLFIYGIGKGEAASVFCVLHHMKQVGYSCCYLLQRRLLNWTKPLHTLLLLGTIMDLSRGKAELIAENAFLRQQLIVLRRQIKRPTCTTTDRLLLVLLAKAVRTWRQALYLVQPETLLRWHRQAFRVWWKRPRDAQRDKLKQGGKQRSSLSIVKQPRKAPSIDISQYRMSDRARWHREKK
jgi:putative transposase